MADVKMIATRERYGNTLKALAAEGHDDLVVLDADLAAATKTGVFRKAHPDLSLIHILCRSFWQTLPSRMWCRRVWARCWAPCSPTSSPTLSAL